jgi:hypothetical protein
MGVWAFLGRSRRQWQTALRLTGTLCCALPVLNAFTSPSNIIDNIQSHQWALVGFDVLAVLLGGAMLFASKRVTLIAKAPTKRPAKTKNARRSESQTSLASDLSSSPSLEEAKS